MPEKVVVYQKGRDTVEVYKRVSRCTNAALVTAKFDLDAGEATQLTGGRLDQNGAQVPFAWLTLKPLPRAVAVRLGAPDAPENLSLSLPSALRWRLYDFDFADFNALARPPERGEMLRWFIALVWPEGPADDALSAMGELTATWAATERRIGVKTYRYRLSGAGFDGGALWLDAKDGTVVEVSAPRPNHPGYTDFQLVLTGRKQGPEAWSAILADHWEGCPPR